MSDESDTLQDIKKRRPNWGKNEWADFAALQTDEVKKQAKTIEQLQARNEQLEAALREIANKRGSYRHQAHNCDHRSALDSCIDLSRNALAALEDK